MIQDILTLLTERSAFFINLCIQHITISMIAICIAIIIGGCIGIFVSEYSKTSKPVLGIINFLYTIPSISMLGFLIPLSGIGNTTAIIALTLYALLPMVRNTYTGIRNVDENIIEASRGMGSTDFQILTKIKLPLALPVIMSGIRNMVTMTIALAGIASFIGAGGLGVAIYRGITTNNAAMTITGSLLIALLALVFDAVLGFIEKSLQVKHIRRNQQKITIISGSIAGLAVLLAAFMFFSKPADNTLHIATKPMTEQYILGEMLEPAMESGEFDLYPEYTGTGWNMVLKQSKLYTEDMFDQLQSGYQDQYQMEWVGMYGFANSYALAVRKSIADQYHLEDISDLQVIADQLIFGAEYDFFEREDGYDPLCAAYNLHFKSTVDLDIGLKYQAINEGKIDVMPIFTTDGQYSIADITVLNDNFNFYPSYQCGNVIRSEVLQHHPELNEIFKQLEQILTDKEMAEMNYEVETMGAEPRDIAMKFLRQKGLI